MQNLLILSVGFLIVSAGFLILLADAIRKSASSLIVLACRRVGLFALSLSCSISKRLLESKSKKSVDNFSPRKSTKKANEHESGWGVGQVRLVGQIGRGRLVRESKPNTPPHGGDGGGSFLSPPANFKTSSAFIVNRAL